MNCPYDACPAGEGTEGYALVVLAMQQHRSRGHSIA